MVIDIHDPAVKRTFTLMLPVTIGLGLININAAIDQLFATHLLNRTLAPAAIVRAFRLYMLPQGVFSVAVATVLFPLLSRHVSRQNWDAFKTTIATGLRLISFFLIPASAAAAVLCVPIVRLLYQHDQFIAKDTPVVAYCLAAFSLGLTFNGTMLMLNRAFFSLQSPWTPTAIALGNLGLNAALATAFYRVGVWGLPLATSLVNIAGTGALLFVFRRRLGRVDGGRLVDSYLRIAVASALAAGAAFAVWYGIDAAVGRSLAGQLLSVGAAVGVSVGLYVALARVFSIRELDVLLSLRRRSATTS
jgi:putative peptidoglycan lipid II flippase